jgi:hypothetical protein
MKIELKIEQKGTKLELSNNNGIKWCFSENIPRDAAIATLVYSTLYANWSKMMDYHNNFEITMEIKTKD